MLIVKRRGQAPRLWAQADLRQRWRSLVALGLLAGVTAGLALAAFAGARRTDSALERLRVATNAPDAVVFSSQVGSYHPDWGPLRARPEVRKVAIWDLVFGNLNGDPGGLLFASHDGEFLGEVGRPVVITGRMYDPRAPDEVVVTEKEAANFPVGSTFAFQPFALEENQLDLSGEPPKGPELKMKVVGKVRLVNQFLFTEQTIISPGFRARYGQSVGMIENADVQLTRGSADVAALQRDVNDVIAPGTPVLDLHAVSRRVDTTLAVEYSALMLLGVVIAVAGGLLVSQALIRSASVIGGDLVVLRAVGMTRRDMTSAAVLDHLLTAAVAMVTAAATAVAASPFLPVGLARRIDVDVGAHVDWLVLGPGAVLVASLVTVGVALVAWRVSGRSASGASTRPSSLAATVRRRAPVAVGLGTSMALERGSGRSSLPTRQAIVGALVGVLGVLAALTINRGINDSLHHPERAGVSWDATVIVDQSGYDPSGMRSEVVDEILAAAPPRSSSVVVDRQVLAVGGVGVPAFTLRAPRGDQPILLSLTKGRAPHAVGEVAIGPETSRILGLRLGDTVAFDSGQKVTVVGFGLFPSDVHAEFDEGLWVTPEQMELVKPSAPVGSEFEGDRSLALRFPEHIGVKTEIDRMSRSLGPPVQNVNPVDVPVELQNLRNVRLLPFLLAAFLALLAVAAVAHVLVASSSRRRADFAVLRAVGLDRPGARVVVSSQGTVIGLIGLLIGAPLGLALGRAGWTIVAEKVPLEVVPPFALIALVLIVPATVLIVNALAIWPGHRAAGVSTSTVLRAE